jgi:hypothetical protein
VTWVIIVAFAGTPVAIYAILLIAIARNGFPAF